MYIIHIKSDANVARGDANPISYKVIPAILLKTKDKGIRMIKVAIKL